MTSWDDVLHDPSVSASTLGQNVKSTGEGTHIVLRDPIKLRYAWMYCDRIADEGVSESSCSGGIPDKLQGHPQNIYLQSSAPHLLVVLWAHCIHALWHVLIMAGLDQRWSKSLDSGSAPAGLWSDRPGPEHSIENGWP